MKSSERSQLDIGVSSRKSQNSQVAKSENSRGFIVDHSQFTPSYSADGHELLLDMSQGDFLSAGVCKRVYDWRVFQHCFAVRLLICSMESVPFGECNQPHYVVLLADFARGTSFTIRVNVCLPDKHALVRCSSASFRVQSLHFWRRVWMIIVGVGSFPLLQRLVPLRDLFLFLSPQTPTLL